MVSLQNECQKEISCDLNPSDGVDGRLTSFAPKIYQRYARVETILKLQDDRLPPPEPSASDGEDNARDAESPYQKVEANVPARMISSSAPVAEKKEEDGRVVEHGDKDLYAHNCQLCSVGGMQCSDIAESSKARTGARAMPSVQSPPMPLFHTFPQCIVMATATANLSTVRSQHYSVWKLVWNCRLCP